MSDTASLAERTRAARSLVSPGWDAARAAHLAERAIARRRRRAIARGVVLSAAAVATVSVVAWLTIPFGGPRPGAGGPAVASSQAGSGVLRLRDGSVVTALDAETEIYVESMSEDAIELVLVRGVARFEVTPGLPRAFRVRAGRATISVVGTVFTVGRSAEGADVSVDEGRVRVDWEPGGHATIGAGEHGSYPAPPAQASALGADGAASASGVVAERSAPAAAVADRAVDAPVIEAVAARAGARPPSPADDPAAAPPGRADLRARDPRPRAREVAPPGPEESEASEATEAPAEARDGWRALADQGRFAEGYGLLLADPTVLPSRDVESLMQAADCARLSGHPAESLAYLRRALEVGADDPRAPMAAFTLGRVLLQQLDRPRDAAVAFARARSLSPEGSLASDALAREVEAWHRAGDASRARERALEYLSLYPEGLRAEAVRQHGGLF